MLRTRNFMPKHPVIERLFIIEDLMRLNDILIPGFAHKNCVSILGCEWNREGSMRNLCLQYARAEL